MAGKKGASGLNPSSWNNRARKCKPWEEALGRYLEIHKPAEQRKKLDLLAAKVYELAMEGDMVAITEIGNRMDGKAKQSVEVTGDNDNPIYLMTAEERMKEIERLRERLGARTIEAIRAPEGGDGIPRWEQNTQLLPGERGVSERVVQEAP